MDGGLLANSTFVEALVVIVAFGLTLIPAVIIHELGHFFMAKVVGITVLEFGIGFPPRAARLGRWRGTDITLNWLPIGGFVRPLGEDMVSQMGEQAAGEDRKEALARGFTRVMSVNEAKPAGRILFLVGGALANFAMAFILFVAVGLLGIPQVFGGLTALPYVNETSSLYADGLRSGDVIRQIDGAYFPDTNALLIALEALGPGDTATLTVLREGQDGPLTLTVRGVSDTDVRQPHPLISGVVEGSPADEAGLLPGDIVLAFNDVPVSTFENLQTQTRQHLGQNVELTIQRAGEERSISVVPRENPPPDEGAMGVQIWQADIVPAAGIVVAEGGPAQELVRLNVVESAEYAFNRIGFFLQTIAQLPGQILSGTADPAAVRLTGPLGIAQMGGLVLVESIEQSRPAIILEFIALISFALGLTNLLPIPALDGGRILFVLIEIVRGRPIAPEREGMVHLIGIALLLSLMVVVLFNDIRDPVVNQMR